MPLVSADIPKSLRIALDQEIARLRTDESAVVTAALSKYLGIPVHTLFQVSTSGALVAGDWCLEQPRPGRVKRATGSRKVAGQFKFSISVSPTPSET
jgi:hypothetical protein